MALFRKRRAVVLYVEDDATNCAVMVQGLGDDFQVICVHTDSEACDYIRKNPQGFDAVLMDIELQGSTINGIDLTRCLCMTLEKACIPKFALDLPHVKVPILFVTAYADLYSPEALKGAGAQEVVLKPVDLPRLRKILLSAIADKPSAADVVRRLR